MGNSIGQIADAMGVSYKTIANSCTRIRGKLGFADVKELVRHAVERRFRGTGFG
ncbi:LuxR C-terminal-related transcriptional regulator [Acidiphilium sp.]|uniref:LuxR C-terminal-related transcriptional regulator n=1 Tax=Acidiphilium sp. TaxID=527 RepID=UPI003D021D4B